MEREKGHSFFLNKLLSHKLGWRLTLDQTDVTP